MKSRDKTRLVHIAYKYLNINICLMEESFEVIVILVKHEVLFSQIWRAMNNQNIIEIEPK